MAEEKSTKEIEMAEEKSVAKDKEFNSHLLFTDLQSIDLVMKARKLLRKQLQ